MSPNPKEVAIDFSNKVADALTPSDEIQDLYARAAELAGEKRVSDASRFVKKAGELSERPQNVAVHLKDDIQLVLEDALEKEGYDTNTNIRGLRISIASDDEGSKEKRYRVPPPKFETGTPKAGELMKDPAFEIVHHRAYSGDRLNKIQEVDPDFLDNVGMDRRSFRETINASRETANKERKGEPLGGANEDRYIDRSRKFALELSKGNFSGKGSLGMDNNKRAAIRATYLEMRNQPDPNTRREIAETLFDFSQSGEIDISDCLLKTNNGSG